MQRQYSSGMIIPLILLVMMSCSREQGQSKTKELPVLRGLDGREHFKPVWTSQSQARLDSLRWKAKVEAIENPSEDHFIWWGRREAYAHNYDTALDIFSKGLAQYPESYRLLRHRGHRYITLRRFDDAIADLSQAAFLMPRDSIEVEPDGIPNAINTPLSNTQFNILYHLGLAHYLKGDFENARTAYEQCLDFSVNDDLRCATADWLYMTYRRLGMKDEATALLLLLPEEMKIIENESYYKRLQLYEGKLGPEELLSATGTPEDRALSLATQGYGVGNWFLYEQDSARALEVFKEVLGGEHFSSFGFIAAEADVVRLAKK